MNRTVSNNTTERILDSGTGKRCGPFINALAIRGCHRPCLVESHFSHRRHCGILCPLRCSWAVRPSPSNLTVLYEMSEPICTQQIELEVPCFWLSDRAELSRLLGDFWSGISDELSALTDEALCSWWFHFAIGVKGAVAVFVKADKLQPEADSVQKFHTVVRRRCTKGSTGIQGARFCDLVYSCGGCTFPLIVTGQEQPQSRISFPLTSEAVRPPIVRFD